jgi:hypothetical protein
VEDAAQEVRDPSGGKHASGGGRPLPLRRLLLLLVLFFAFSIPLAWLWREWGLLRYLAFLLEILRALHEAMGWPFTAKGIGGLSLRFVTHVPFLVLVLLTPGLSGRRQLFPLILVMDGLPLILWMVVARDFLRTLIPGLREDAPASEPPG